MIIKRTGEGEEGGPPGTGATKTASKTHTFFITQEAKLITILIYFKTNEINIRSI